MTSIPRRIRIRLSFATTAKRPRAKRAIAKPRLRARNPSATAGTPRLLAEQEHDREDAGEEDERLDGQVEGPLQPERVADPGWTERRRRARTEDRQDGRDEDEEEDRRRRHGKGGLRPRHAPASSARSRPPTRVIATMNSTATSPAPTVSSRTAAKGAPRTNIAAATKALPAAKAAIARMRSRTWRANKKKVN